LLCPEVLFFSVLHYFYFLLFSAKLNDFWNIGFSNGNCKRVVFFLYAM
jgi:hypothetical protein